IVGIVLASGPELRGGAAARSSVALAGFAAAGFGTVLVALAEGSRTSVAMTLLAMRAVTAVCGGVAIAVLLALRRGIGPAWPAGRERWTLGLIGLGDAGATGAYSVATTGGLVSVVAVLASLYPVTTALLARELHGERLRRIQVAGVVAVLGGVVLLVAG
ncbi:MAG: EamA family transporter, partial [Mycobacteriales bacterium]